MEVLDAVYILEGKSKPLPVLGTDQLIDVERMNRLIAFPIATTVAKGLPASGKTCEEQIGHDSSSSVLAHNPASPALVLAAPDWRAAA
jgi:hypothetical protein